MGYIHLGKPGVLKQEAQRFIDNLAALGGKEVVCFHDDCYTLLTTLAEQFGLQVPFRPVHIFEYLCLELEKRQEAIRPVPIRVAYQSPCASRYTQEKEVYLERIFQLLGVERPYAPVGGLAGPLLRSPPHGQGQGQGSRYQTKEHR